MRRTCLLIALVCAMSPLVSRADVTASTPNGFTVKVSTVIHAGPELVYDRLVHNVGDWWSPAHTFSNDSHNLSIDDKPMGCFCEKMPNNGGVRHAEVIMVMPNKLLVLSGALGPLQKFAVTGTMTIALLPMHHDTRIELTYEVGGFVPGGTETWAAPVDQVLTEQVSRLKNYVETGHPEDAAKAK